MFIKGVRKDGFKKLLCSLFFATNFTAVNLTVAEVIEIPLSTQGGEKSESIQKPSRGASQQDVLTNFGSPVKQTPAVGTPSISRWEYQDYYVYFENNHVIHAVLKHKPPSVK